MAPNPNLNLFSLINEKNMERALFKDCRVKRLKAEVEKRNGFKIAAYSASLILEENLSVDAAATVVCSHLVEKEKANYGKKLNKETNRERSRSRSRSQSKTMRKNPDRNHHSSTLKESSKLETNRERSRSRSRSQSKTMRKNPDRNHHSSTLKESSKLETNRERSTSRSRSQSKTMRKNPDRNHHSSTVKESSKLETNRERSTSRSRSQSKTMRKNPDRKLYTSTLKESSKLETSDVVQIVAGLLPELLPSIVEGVMEKMKKEIVFLLGDSILRRMQRTKFFKEKFAGKPVIDQAISGSTIVKGLQTFSHYCTNRQKAFFKLSNLVILLGTNDFLKSGRFDYTHYYDLTTYAVSLSFKKIILVKMPPILKKPFLSEDIQEANIWIASIGRSKGLQVIEAPQNVSKDGVHLTEWGMKALATSIFQHVSE